MFLWVLGLAALLVVVDQATKFWAVSALADGRVIDVIGELIQFRLIYNPGAAFSIGTEFTWIFAVASAAVVVIVAWIARRVRTWPWTIALGLVLGGATTHLLDRLFREPGFARGAVVDFIDYFDWFVGNVADIALVLGILWAALLHLRGIGLDGQREGQRTERGPDAAGPVDTAES
ncbi:signal peptidase II [Thermopolyspora sp. NPDC052614]|uniref:signal peptidase II n=1 Tax=Thermopolyspora sp. NPDC052614 TaxID=3155682 RepID=UPI0034336C1C